ncbi:helix-turn-helix transcriptional regulator [Leuconostoc koreense]|nr:helix-turn-helix transcriptional regulator [Leuconostoc mesenteroides]QGM25219.1 helix-turn-helix domain-containing protein [Leuconostoc mesenteroides subsp. mesenteroides]
MTNNIRLVRKHQQKLLKDVSKDLKIPVNTLSNYERGDREPKLETWIKLSDYFDVPVGYLQGIRSPENEDEYYNQLIQQTIHSSNNYMQNSDDEVFKGWLMFITSLYEQSKADKKIADVDALITALSLISNEIVMGIEPSNGQSGVDEGLNLLNQTIKKLQSKKHVIHGSNEIKYLSDSEYLNFLKAQNKKASDDKPETER